MQRWELAKERDEARYYQQYLEQFPEGKYVEEAHEALEKWRDVTNFQTLVTIVQPPIFSLLHLAAKD